MGMRQDMKQRETLARVNNNDRRWKVNFAQEILYKKNYAINTENVETLLQPQSLVPTSVSIKEQCPSPKQAQTLTISYRTPFQRGFAASVLICILCSL